MPDSITKFSMPTSCSLKEVERLAHALTKKGFKAEAGPLRERSIVITTKGKLTKQEIFEVGIYAGYALGLEDDESRD